MKFVKHELVKTGMEGNGFHGNCKHCGASLETWLGGGGWGRECIEREITNEYDVPDEIRSYANFNGMRWKHHLKKYHKPFTDDYFTIDELNEKINKLKIQQ